MKIKKDLSTMKPLTFVRDHPPQIASYPKNSNHMNGMLYIDYPTI